MGRDGDDWLPDLEISQHRKTGGSREKVLERMPAQDEICMDHLIGELEPFCKRIAPASLIRDAPATGQASSAAA
jgi:hypothetical protein